MMYIGAIVLFAIGVVIYLAVTEVLPNQDGVTNVDVRVHHSQTRNYSDAVAEGTFEDFLRCYANRNWIHKPAFPESHFSEGDDTEIHANIIKFDGVGMLLDKAAYKKFKRWEKEHSLQNRPVVLENKEWI